MSEETIRQLFGHAILSHELLTYEQQLYDIFLEEIHGGKWSVGEKLPGILSVARQTGLGTKTVHNVFDMLKRDGYIESSKHRGSFLKNHPSGRKSQGKIGILLTNEQSRNRLILWYQHLILTAVERREMQIEVKVLPADMDPHEAVRRSVLFSRDVTGIISLTPFDHFPFSDSLDSVIPLVFLCEPFRYCGPKVSADVELAYYELTRQMAAAGHTRILFCMDQNSLDLRQSEMHLQGYLKAMGELSLDVDYEAIELSKELDNSDLRGLQVFLKKIKKMKALSRPTAIVSGAIDRTVALINVAPLCGVNVPDHLSIGSIGSTYLTQAGRRLLITGMLPDFDKMMDACFRHLFEYKSTGGVSTTTSLMRMCFIPGDTLITVPGGKKAACSNLVYKSYVDTLIESVHDWSH